MAEGEAPPAAELFVKRARGVAADFELGKHAAAVTDVCRRPTACRWPSSWPPRVCAKFYIHRLSLPDDTATVDVAAPFKAEQNDDTYLLPGIRKVVQVDGRVIRTPSDRGGLQLMDDRFARPEVRRLLPAWWCVEAG